MKRSRRSRTARKLVLPLIAVGVMTLMMALHSGNAGAQTSPSPVLVQP